MKYSEKLARRIALFSILALASCFAGVMAKPAPSAAGGQANTAKSAVVGSVSRAKFLGIVENLPGMTQSDLVANLGAPYKVQKSNLPDSQSLDYIVEPRFKCDPSSDKESNPNLTIKTQHGVVRYFQIHLDTHCRVKDYNELLKLKIEESENQGSSSQAQIDANVEKQICPFIAGNGQPERWLRFQRLLSTCDNADIRRIHNLLGPGRSSERVPYKGKIPRSQYYFMLLDLKRTPRIQNVSLTYNEEEKLVEITFTDDPEGAKNVR